MKDKKRKEYSELNIERWPIFCTLERGKTEKSRVIEREIKTENGIEKQKVIVGYVEGIGTLYVCDYVNYSLLVNVALKKTEDGRLITSLLSLIKELDLGESARNYDAFKKSLIRLSSVPMYFKNSFIGKDGKVINIEGALTLLSSVKIFERKKDIEQGQGYLGLSEIVINPVIWRSIKERNVKPIRLDVLKNLRSETAILLYKHIDLVMFDKKVYERDIVELAEDVGITEKRVRRIRLRIQKAIKELEGKELTSGRIKKIEIVKSETGSGWKIRVEKGKHIKDSEQQQQIEERGYWLNVYNNLSEEEKAEVDKYVDEQMKRFYELTGRDGGDIYRELVIIEYLKEKGGKK